MLIVLVNSRAAKLTKVDIHAAAGVERRQKRPAQNGIAIIAETFQKTSKPCTTLSKLKAKKMPAKTTTAATIRPMSM